jgi:hypothetical protein
LKDGNCENCTEIPGMLPNSYDKLCKATKCLTNYKLNSGICESCGSIMPGMIGDYDETCKAKACDKTYMLLNGKCEKCAVIPGMVGDYDTGTCKAKACDFNYNLINGNCDSKIKIANNNNFLNSNSSNISLIKNLDKYDVIVNGTVEGANIWSYEDIKDCEYIITNVSSKRSLDSGEPYFYSYDR